MTRVTGSPPCPSLPQVFNIWLREGRMWVWLLLACQVAARTEKKIALCPQLADRIYKASSPFVAQSETA